MGRRKEEVDLRLGHDECWKRIGRLDGTSGTETKSCEPAFFRWGNWVGRSVGQRTLHNLPDSGFNMPRIVPLSLDLDRTFLALVEQKAEIP